MKKTTVTFGEYLKHKREEKHISLREVARTLGVSAPFLSILPFRHHLNTVEHQ